MVGETPQQQQQQQNLGSKLLAMYSTVYQYIIYFGNTPPTS